MLRLIQVVVQVSVLVHGTVGVRLPNSFRRVTVTVSGP